MYLMGDEYGERVDELERTRYMRPDDPPIGF